MSGKYEDLRDEYKNSTLLMNVFEDIYKRETTIPEDALSEYLKTEVFIDTNKCVEYGIFSRVLDRQIPR